MRICQSILPSTNFSRKLTNGFTTRGEVVALSRQLVVAVAERDVAREKVAHQLIRIDRFQEGRQIVNKELERLLQEGFCVRVEIERLKSRKVLRGKDKGTRMPAVPPPVEVVGVGIQVEMPEVSTVAIQPNVSNVQVSRRTTYASVASQACPEVSPAAGDEVVKMGRSGVAH